MIQIRKSKERGYADHGWLKSYHSFSFADYYDPNFMGFGPLRVINEDFIDGGQGFPTHGHRNMEIITYMISGALEHKDSTGSSGIIRPYEVQKMSAGKGIRHSEFNHLQNETAHLLQIWIEPNETEISPYYQQIDFKSRLLSQQATLIASAEGSSETIKLHQNAQLWGKVSQSREIWKMELNTTRKYWLQVAKGEIQLLLKGQTASPQPLLVQQGDAIAMTDASYFELTSQTDSEVLFFDI